MATETNTDNFSAAFDQLAALGDKPIPVDFSQEDDKTAAADAEKAATKAEATPAVETPAPEAPAVEETHAVEEGLEDLTPEEKAAAAAAEKPAATETEGVTDREADLLAKFAKVIKDDKPTEKVAEQPRQQAQEPILFSPDEAAFLAEYNKDWPDVARAQSIQMRAMATQITSHIFSEFAKTLGPRLALLDSLADRSHEQDLHQVVNDYDDVRDKVIEWAGKQPTYLREAYGRVISEGTVDEVKDLIDRYRKDTGTTLTPAPAKKQVTELSTTAKKAAEALAPVGSKRSAVVRQTSPDDFEGAFAEFAKNLET